MLFGIDVRGVWRLELELVRQTYEDPAGLVYRSAGNYLRRGIGCMGQVHAIGP
jgi:hypothetical protein